mmetsp:Transcript_2681/g.3588  ORF Transcript_2681/g.3588 Transcript_2681/m.3588 type:complete len:607 (-) Transcript_2681:71-1891(-)
MEEVDAKLKRLADKAQEWRDLALEKKLEYLEQILKVVIKSEDLIIEVVTVYAEELKKAKGEELEYLVAEDAIFHVAVAKGTLNARVESIRAKLGIKGSVKALSDLEMRQTSSGHVAAKIFPLLPDEKTGPTKDGVGELWFLRDKVKAIEDAKPWQFDEFKGEQPGLSVVLGAGNYPALALNDCINELFQKGNVVFLKQHHIRSKMEDIMRVVFKPLYDAGYFDSEVFVNAERDSQIVYSPHVKLVHMTGGKASHDTIVWGSTTEEQSKRKANNDPKLKAKMSSELGAATPHIITPVHYDKKALNYQARVLVSAKWINGGASCNAPQCVIMSDQWEQREEFVGLLQKYWTEMYSPVAYYAGTQERVDAFQYRYKSTSTTWMGKVPSGASSNHMPLLVVSVDVDVSTEAGMKAAKEEYAFQNEAFGPILVLCTLKTKAETKDFMGKAVPLCNDCLFGTLSCVIVTPNNMLDEQVIENAVAELKYGSVVFNAWAGVGYGLWFGTWGGFPGEKLENIESGTGHVNNSLFFSNIEKTVYKAPINEILNPLVVSTMPRHKLTKVFRAIVKLLLKSSAWNLIGVLAALIGPAFYLVPSALVAVAAVGIGYYFR